MKHSVFLNNYKYICFFNILYVLDEMVFPVGRGFNDVRISNIRKVSLILTPVFLLPWMRKEVFQDSSQKGISQIYPDQSHGNVFHIRKALEMQHSCKNFWLMYTPKDEGRKVDIRTVVLWCYMCGPYINILNKLSILYVSTLSIQSGKMIFWWISNFTFFPRSPLLF